MISELRGSRKYYSLDNLCALFGYTRQAWYSHLRRSELQVLQEYIVLQRIGEIRKLLPATGCIKLYKELNSGFLQKLHLSMGRDAIFDLVRANGLLIRVKKKRIYTTDSCHRFKIYPDLVQRRAATKAEEIWVSDITYIRIAESFGFLSLVTDAYSRKIMGYYLAKDLKAVGCLKALNMAILHRNYPDRILIHHSDRGTQYCCDDYIFLLNHHGLQISMTQSGSPYDNAIAERINGILKAEFKLQNVFSNFAEANTAVEVAIYKYNHLRLHASCGYKTPQYTHMQEHMS